MNIRLKELDDFDAVYNSYVYYDRQYQQAVKEFDDERQKKLAFPVLRRLKQMLQVGFIDEAYPELSSDDRNDLKTKLLFDTLNLLTSLDRDTLVRPAINGLVSKIYSYNEDSVEISRTLGEILFEINEFDRASEMLYNARDYVDDESILYMTLSAKIAEVKILMGCDLINRSIINNKKAELIKKEYEVFDLNDDMGGYDSQVDRNIVLEGIGVLERLIQQNSSEKDIFEGEDFNVYFLLSTGYSILNQKRNKMYYLKKAFSVGSSDEVYEVGVSFHLSRNFDIALMAYNEWQNKLNIDLKGFDKRSDLLLDLVLLAQQKELPTEITFKYPGVHNNGNYIIYNPKKNTHSKTTQEIINRRKSMRIVK